MIRMVVSGLAAAALASAAMAQQLDTFGRQSTPNERNRGIGLRLDDRLAFLGQKLFFDAPYLEPAGQRVPVVMIRAMPLQSRVGLASPTADGTGGAMLPRC